MDNYKNDRIDRYVYQVVRALPRKNRGDIEKEIRSLINDMLEERCGGREPQQKDVDIVLIELGDPRTLAARYSEKGERYLIGPALYPRYIFLLKIVGICVAGGITLAMIIQSFFNTGVSPFSHFTRWFATLLSALFGVFTWITVIFALIENREHSRIGKALDESLGEVEREFTGKGEGGTFLDRLPEVPQKKAEIGRGEPIAGLAFSVVFLVLFIAVPQIFAVYIPTENGVTTIPIFNLSVVRTLIWPMILCTALGIVREIARLIEGRHSLRIAFITIACDLPALLLAIYIFTRENLFNPTLFEDISRVWPDTADGLATIAPFFRFFGTFFVWIFIFGFIVDMITALVKGIKYN